MMAANAFVFFAFCCASLACSTSPMFATWTICRICSSLSVAAAALPESPVLPPAGLPGLVEPVVGAWVAPVALASCPS
jgi:hypothetical protein